MKRLMIILSFMLGMVTVPAYANEQVSVLPVGDSITQGYDGDYTWRYFASVSLESSYDFVGPYTGTHLASEDWSTYFGGSYGDPNFDQDHAGAWGESIEGATTTWNRVEPWVQTYQPDVVVDALGVNDVRSGVDPVAVADRQRVFVDMVRNAKPDADVLLVQLPQTWIAGVNEYNAALSVVATSLSTPESRVGITPLPNWTRDGSTTDGLHPSTEGQRVLAAAILDGLKAIGYDVSPEPIIIPTPVIEKETQQVDGKIVRTRYNKRKRFFRAIVKSEQGAGPSTPVEWTVWVNYKHRLTAVQDWGDRDRLWARLPRAKKTKRVSVLIRKNGRVVFHKKYRVKGRGRQ